MKDYNIKSCQWMACDRFRQPTQDHRCALCKKYLFPTSCGWLERGSFSQKKHTLREGEGEGCPKRNKGKKGDRGVTIWESWLNILFECLLFILITILSSILFMYILIEGLSVTASCCLEYLIPKWSIRYSNFFIKCWSRNSEFIIPTKRFYLCPCIVNGKFDKAVYLSFLKSILFLRLSNSLSGSDFYCI